MNIPVQLEIPDEEKTRSFSPPGLPRLLTVGRGSRVLGATVRLCRAAGSVLIGNDSVLEKDVTICLDGEEAGAPAAEIAPDIWGSDASQVLIGSDVRIGSGVTILGGVAVGSGAVVQPDAVVARDVPPYAAVAGNPAQVVWYRFPADVVKKLLSLQWWNWPSARVRELAQVTDIAAFLDSHPLPPPPVPGKALETMKREGRTICFFAPALKEDGEEICRHVLAQYIERFHAGDTVALLVEVDEDGSGLPAMVQELCRGKAQSPLLAFLRKAGAVPRAALRSADYLITTKSGRSLSYWENGEDFDLRRLYGLSDDVFSPLTECRRSPDTVPPLSLKSKRHVFEQDIRRKKGDIAALMKQGNREGALRSVMTLASLLYHYNQEYTDEFLEDCLQETALFLGKENDFGYSVPDRATVLFFDAFGLDTRGLAQIYLEALGALGYHILYLVPEVVRDRIPTLEAVLRRHGATILTYPKEPLFSSYAAICQTIRQYRPRAGFLYTWPYDVAGILAFMHFAGSMTRYLVNLTDHAFWLGRNAFDYCLEFRNYGAYVSTAYRKIPREKLLMLPFYPALNQEHEFEGYPFPRTPGDFVIFSGGALYKTMDEEKTYYRIVAECLTRHPQVKFWYAGRGDDTYLRELMAEFPGRVFFTAERKDLFALLRQVDMYLNTYPLGGTLMMQFAAMAGRAPLTLRQDDALGESLIGQETLGIEFDTPEKLQAAMSRFVTDPAYRASLEKDIDRAVVRPAEFRAKLHQYIETPAPGNLNPTPVETEAFRRGYLERFLKKFTVFLPPSAGTEGDAR